MLESRVPALTSVAIHSGIVALLCVISTSDDIRRSVEAAAERVTPLIAPYFHAASGGGGRSILPASRGRLPKLAPRQFTPPMAALYNSRPRLAMEPTLIASPELTLPETNVTELGDPLGKLGPRSNGPGYGGGIGDGCCNGVGPGKGPGYGPGQGGVGELRASTGAVTSPVLLFKVEPEFSEEARRAKHQGVVILYGEVGTDGRLRNVRVVSSLGLGLDEKAITAVRQWRFRPGFRDGRPVVAAATIEVNFHLL